MLIVWNAILAPKGKFLEDENGFFIPRKEIIEAAESAYVFYLIKKDKNLEHKIYKLIQNFKGNLKALSKEIKKEVLKDKKLNLELEEKIYLPKDGLYNIEVKEFDFKQKEFINSFKSQLFKGTLEVEVKNLENYKAALDSFARALANYEHQKLKETKLEELIIDIQNSIANEWDNTLRIGAWDKGKRDFLYFWRFKELRDKLFENQSVALKSIYYIPKFKEFSGWSEYTTEF